MSKKTKDVTLPEGLFDEKDMKRLKDRVTKMKDAAKANSFKLLNRMSSRDAFHAQAKFVAPVQLHKEKDKAYESRLEKAREAHAQRKADLDKTSRLASNLARRVMEGEFREGAKS